MPNHIHFIIHIEGRADPAPTLGQIMGYFKYQTSKEIDVSGFWQRSYYDHIIRSEDEYQKIYQYIDTNPIKWSEDRYYIHK
jgi:REP element-mobilizing transposase RayT